MRAPLPPREPERLAELHAYGLLDTPPDPAIDEITELAAAICGAPIGLISLLDEHRQWFKSRVGLDLPETPRDYSICAHALLRPTELFIVPDAAADERFADNPMVTGEPGIRFYAGAPLVMSSGLPLGTLCVIDRQPRNLTPLQARALALLRNRVVKEFELWRKVAQLQQALRDLDTARTSLRELAALVPVCAHCRRVRDDEGYWRQVEDYVARMGENRHQHGLCPECAATAARG